MAAIVDISVLGDNDLVTALGTLPDNVQKRVVRAALKKSAVRIKKALVPAIPVLTGTFQAAVSRSTAKVLTGRKFSVGAVVPLPLRSELGISLEDKGYYPAVLEYGAPADGIAARRMYRDTTDKMAVGELAAITSDIRKGIEREWGKDTAGKAVDAGIESLAGFEAAAAGGELSA